MRRSLTVAAAAGALLVLPFAGSASAAGCAAYAVPPHYDYQSARILAVGAFSCDTPAAGMTVTVCIEDSSLLDGQWSSHGCTTTTADGEVTTIVGTHDIDVPVYATWLRTVVTASNGSGATGGTKSAPLFWFNCACYIG